MEQKQIAKGPTKTRVADKYQAMVTYYAELIGLCHETVSKLLEISKKEDQVKTA
jgi:hypothetical protein